MPAKAPRSNDLYHSSIAGFGWEENDVESPVKPTKRFKQEVKQESSRPTQRSGQKEQSMAYPFNHDVLGSTRLDLQHQLWAASHGWLLHPEIPAAKHGTIIADVGCGTGIWSLSLSPQLPEGAQISAFDLSTAQMLPQSWWPNNTSFQQFNIFDPIPSSLLGKFDIIHIRLFVCVVQNNDPIPLLKQLLLLLKPSGYLQWQEYDPSTDTILTANPKASAPKLEALRKAITAPGQHANMTWIKTLHYRFEAELGLKLIAHERKTTLKEMYGVKQDITFLAVREWCANLRTKGNTQDAMKFEKLCEEAEEECWALGRGSVIDSEMVTWVVQKPVE